MVYDIHTEKWLATVRAETALAAAKAVKNEDL
jgi:hypothetical protein